MTDSLERFLHDLTFEVPAGLVDRAKAAASNAPAMTHDPRAIGETSLDRVQHAPGQPALPRQPPTRSEPRDGYTGIGRRTELAAGIAAVVIAAIVIGTFVYIRGVASPVAPAVPDPAIKQYQAIVGADQVATLVFLNYQCTVNPPESTACADAAAAAIGPLQQWLDDLDQTRPPGRFTAIDGRLRHHLALTMMQLRAVLAANKAMDESGATTAVAAAQSERDTVNREASAILLLNQETVRSYSGIVRLNNSKLLACDLCQSLVSQNQVSCQASQTPSCVDEIGATRLQVESFQDDLVRGVAPGPMAAKDRRLQTDLLAADAALDAMDSALSAGDQVQLGAGQNALRQALSRVGSDAAGIARGA